jgi:hypothetical protein
MSDNAPIHARLAPSAASRWTTCTASIKFIEGNEHLLPPDDSSEYADEGTRAHAAAAELLLNPDATPAFDNDEMAGYVGDFVDFVRSLIPTGGSRLYVEQRVPLFYFPAQRGTLDVGIVAKDFSRVTIVDLKYGAGVGVYAKDNKQLAIYAESFISELEEVLDPFPDEALVTLIIYQPRDRNDDNPVRLWAISRKDLADFADQQILPAVETILANEPGVFVADPQGHCRFCRAKGICQHYASHGLEALPVPASEEVVDPSKVSRMEALPSPHTLTREQRIRVIRARSSLEKWLEAVEAQEVAELMAGAPRMGLKIVEGKSNRAWADEGAAEQLLRNHLAAEEARPPGKLVSPAQAEKLLKKMELSTKFQNKLTSLIVKPVGQPSLVPEEDKRPALSLDQAEGFKQVEVADCL